MKYLPEQIATLLGQDFDGKLSILIRDDGSTDGTPEYISSRCDPRIRLVTGDNLGPRESYFELLRLAREVDGDFFALSDQDDFWLSDKISRAISMIPQDDPAIYASSLDLADYDLAEIGHFKHPGDRSFVSTLLCNYVTGCTCIVNRAFLDWMPFPENSNKTIMHDWWLAAVGTLGAQVIYDTQSRILYRQHALNHIGIKTGISGVIAKLKKIVKRHSTASRFDQAAELSAASGTRMSKEQREIIDSFLAARTSTLRRLRFIIKYSTNINARSAIRFLLLG